MKRDREDFRVDYGNGSEPEREFDDREQADVPERDDRDDEPDPFGHDLEVLKTEIDELYGQLDGIQDRIQELSNSEGEILDRISDLEARLEQLEET